MNKMKKFLLQAMAIKLAVVFLGISIMGVGYALGELWFKLNVTDDEITTAINNAPLQDIDARNEFGQTGLMFAAAAGKEEMAKQLIARGADINAISQDVDRNTPLHIAVNSSSVPRSYNRIENNTSVPGSYNIALMLIEKGAKVNIKNNLGQQPIHFIIQVSPSLPGSYEARLHLLQRLLDAGADINAQDDDGNTMLHLSVSIHDILWLEALLAKYGSILNKSLKTLQGKTAYDMARESNVNSPDDTLLAKLKP
jgi:ankyrin repeat protein